MLQALLSVLVSGDVLGLGHIFLLVPGLMRDDTETRVVRRTITTSVRNIKADRPWTVPLSF